MGKQVLRQRDDPNRCRDEGDGEDDQLHRVCRGRRQSPPTSRARRRAR